MQHTAGEVLAMFRADAIAIVIAAVLCTMGAGMLLLSALSARHARRPFLYTGLFAIVYGVRLALNTSSFGLLSGHPRWLDYTRSALEYLVPIPAALLFKSFGEGRRHAVHRIVTTALTICAAVAIPFEIAIHSPYALKPVIDALVLVLVAVLAFDLLVPGEGTRHWRLVRIGALVFTVFVINEHMRFVSDPIGLTREPAGFLFLMLTIVIATMREGTRAQQRLVAVDSELATARAIQLAALPRTNPNLAGLEIATIYKPASEVAGDFYDFIELDNNALGVFIADVSGHGVPAALVASMLKIALATQIENASSPARILSSLNALFYVDPNAGTIVVASAGHPPPIFRHNETSTEIVAPGVVLGRFRDARYEELTRPFVPGDTLILYTDGVTETANRDAEIWGDERLRTTITNHVHDNTGTLAISIINEVAEWRGSTGPPDDDVTLIVVRRMGG
jgi:sigma-B regulation protein RsbU (phosphoserine phosphatase)